MIIGVTGGIASGKSEVCRILSRHGFTHIDADVIAHQVLEMPDVIDEIVSVFGEGVLAESECGNGARVIDRKKLGKIVFADPGLLDVLEGISHPRVVSEIKRLISQRGNYVIEAIAMVSSGMIEFCDEFWVVHAEPEQQIERLIKYRGLTYDEALARLKSQEDHDWDEITADRVIYSTEPIETMEKQVTDALKL